MVALKSWVMVILTAIFVVLYTGALLGWLRPLSDVTMVMRLEPIIFVIIGYYFGRVPSHQNEQNLKDEITRQSKKVDAAHYSREQIQQERDATEEKLKNVKTVLMPPNSRESVKLKFADDVRSNEETNLQILQQSIKTAVNILDS